MSANSLRTEHGDRTRDDAEKAGQYMYSEDGEKKW